MRRFFRNEVVWFVMCLAFIVMVGLETPSAQQYFTYVGKVVSISGEFLGVQGSKGDVMYFALGRKTIYLPTHVPAVGERVKISYFFRKGNNVAHQVEILPPPPPPPPPPPVPTTTITTPQEQETKEKKPIFGCTRCSTSREAGKKK